MTLNLRLLCVLLFAFMLTITPLPAVIATARPSLVLLLVLYLQFFLPAYVNSIVIFLIGLSMDILLSTALGEHAFALLLTTVVTAGKARRFSFFSLGQQMILIAVFCLVYQSIIFVIEACLGYHNGLIMLVAPALISMFLWPWLKLLADNSFFIKAKVY